MSEIRRIVKPDNVLLLGDGFFSNTPCAVVPIEDVNALYDHSYTYPVNDARLIKWIERMGTADNFELVDRFSDPSKGISYRLYATEHALLGVGLKRLGMDQWQIDPNPDQVGLWILRNMDLYRIHGDLGHRRHIEINKITSDSPLMPEILTKRRQN